MFKPFNNAIWQNQKQLFIKPLIPLRFDNTFSDRELHCLIKLHYNGLNKNKFLQRKPIKYTHTLKTDRNITNTPILYFAKYFFSLKIK